MPAEGRHNAVVVVAVVAPLRCNWQMMTVLAC
jgi:hypothetical protein